MSEGRQAGRGTPSLDAVLEALDALLLQRQAMLGKAPGSGPPAAGVPLLQDLVQAGDAARVEAARQGATGGPDTAGPVAELAGHVADIVGRRLDEANATARREILLQVSQLLEESLGGLLPPAAVPVLDDRVSTRPDAEQPSDPTSMSTPPNTEASTPAEPGGERPGGNADEAAARAYDPASIERYWYERWEREGCFQPAGEGAPYCIMLPPPNVTGSLHMGHAFQDTLMDALVRFHRMRGDRTLWQCGTDHAGIATQMVVERQLAERGQSRHELGRERFVEEVWRWKETSGGHITRQLRRMGASTDWSRERFTLDEGLSHAVTEVFVQLYEKGLIYRGKRLVNWDPVLHTAISDLEVIAEEENGHLWHIDYPLADAEGAVTVATTRPETLLGDVAVAVHPDDERYRHLIGSRVHLPLTGRTVPIIADEYVDPAFGSGCVKITPAHDFNDYAVGERHQLPLINIFTVDAAINEEAPEAYRGLDRFAARKRILADLEAAGLLARTEPRRLMVPRGDRSHAVIEPYLTDQWFVRAQPLAEPALKAVEAGHIRFVPGNWAKTYYEWMRNIQDWCISRQLWWGHRIPAWYDSEGRVHVGRTEAQARARAGLAPSVPLTRDTDVLDTWFSSALWPFSTLGWPERTPELQQFYPTSVLVSGFDIIFFWVARMIMMGLEFTGEVPFREVYIHGLVRDQDGQKMSKSKGNIIDPIDLIDGIDLEALVAKRTRGLMRPQDAPRIEAATRRQFPEGIRGYGTDALRFTFAALATHGRDIKFDLGRIEGYRNFCNKLWNAARYVLMSCEPAGPAGDCVPEHGVAEHWIRSRLQQTVRDVLEAFEGYRFDLAAQAIYSFVWDEFCDWYLELSKTVLADPGAAEAAKAGTRQTLLETLDALLRLAHPIMPFITEELWQRLGPFLGREGGTLMRQAYPQPDPALEHPGAVRQIEWVKSFVLGVRRIRAEMNIPPGKRLPVLVRGGSDEERQWLQSSRACLQGLARVSGLGEPAEGEVPEAATALAGDMTLLIPLADLIDPEAEYQRLARELEKLSRDGERLRAKLANDKFVQRAPAEVVAKERARAAEIDAAMERLEAQRLRIDALRAPRGRAPAAPGPKAGG